MDTNKHPTDGPTPMTATENCCGSRMNAYHSLLDKARRLHKEANDLERLAGALPTELNPEADRALWNLITKV